VKFVIEIEVDDPPSYAEEVICKSIALKAARGALLDSNFTLSITRVGPFRIESGFIRRVN